MLTHLQTKEFAHASHKDLVRLLERAVELHSLHGVKTLFNNLGGKDVLEKSAKKGLFIQAINIGNSRMCHLLNDLGAAGSGAGVPCEIFMRVKDSEIYNLLVNIASRNKHADTARRVNLKLIESVIQMLPLEFIRTQLKAVAQEDREYVKAALWIGKAANPEYLRGLLKVMADILKIDEIEAIGTHAHRVHIVYSKMVRKSMNEGIESRRFGDFARLSRFEDLYSTEEYWESTQIIADFVQRYREENAEKKDASQSTADAAEIQGRFHLGQ